MTIKSSNLVLTGLLLIAPVWSASAASVDVYAGYDYSSPDYIANSYFTISNSSEYTLSNLSFTAIGDGETTALTDSATWSWTETVAANSDLTLYFPTDSSSISGTGWGFTADYGWYYSGNDQTYTFSVDINGETYSTTFSTLDNLSEMFIAFLGNDEYGDYLPLDTSGLVASIATSGDVAPVPLPASFLLMLTGLTPLAWGQRRRNK